VSFVPRFGLSLDKIKEFGRAEFEMRKSDELEERIDETRNELERDIFQLQNGLERDFPEFYDSAKKGEYQVKLDEVSTWLSDNEFDRLTVEEYSSKLKALKDIGILQFVAHDVGAAAWKCVLVQSTLSHPQSKRATQPTRYRTPRTSLGSLARANPSHHLSVN
jgi:hypothetical protein